ncbi:MAG: DUF4256 domain-containing protein [Cytophagaceae bacterium]
MKSKKKLSSSESSVLLEILKQRFEKNKNRHKTIAWDRVEEALLKNSDKLCSLELMEKSGGEPDVIGEDKKSGQIIFADCSAESPKDRRSLCYDLEAWSSRKENKPKGNIMDLAEEMGVEVMTEEQYIQLQKLGDFDLKTSSWLKTSEEVRAKGGAIFGDKRYGRVFFYHNGAESYYAARGFRTILLV